MKKMIKRRIQKLVLICSTLMMSIPAAALSGGAIAGITVGAVAAATIIGVSVHKHNKHKNGTCTKSNCKQCEKAHRAEERQSTASNKSMKQQSTKKADSSMMASSTQTKRSLKKDLKRAKSERSKHNSALDRLQKDGKENSPVAQAHRTELEQIEDDIRNLERRIETAL